MEKKLKKCKKCKEDIDEKAKKCPHCGSRQGMPIWLIILIVFIVIGFISSMGDNSEDYSDNENESNNSSQIQENINYIKISKDDLDEALENNAAAAKETYNNKYVEVSGKLGTIDSDLKYIYLMSSTDEWDINGIHCTIKNKDQKDIVKSLTKNQEITIKGKITDVGEVLGYYMDINEIIAN